MAQNPATLEHVTGAIERPLDTDEIRVLPNWINTAWTRLRLQVPGLEARMDLEAGSPARLDEDTVRVVLVAMVERKLRNPEGRRSFTGDDYTEQVDSVLSSGQIYATAEDLQLLAPPRSGAANGIYSIPLSVL